MRILFDTNIIISREDNKVIDEDLKDLEDISLSNNQIKDVSCLKEMESLKIVNTYGNPLTEKF